MKLNKLLTVVLSLLLISGTVFNLGKVFWQYRQNYTTRYYWESFSSLKKIFNNSQYVSKHPTAIIPDEVAFSYASGMLIKGVNPVLVIPDAPPLGKYLIGLSILAFDNPNMITAVSVVLSLVLLYFVGKQVFKNNLTALIPPFLISSEKMFTNQIIYTPLLDVIQLVFILSSFLFFNFWLTRKKTFYLYGAFLSIGCFMATKFWVSGATIIGAMVVIILLHKLWKGFVASIVGSVAAGLIVLLSYARVFAFGYSLRSFLGIQKWIFLYHKSQLILPFSVWQLLLFNRWYVWYGNNPISSDPQWSILWPLSTIGWIVVSILYIFGKIERKITVEIFLLWPIVYLLFLSFGEIFSRYFIILLPVMYVATIYGLERVVVKIIKK